MKKLYAGLAAAAMTATGIACTAGAAHATGSPWPSDLGYAPPNSGVVSTAVASDGTIYTAALNNAGDAVNVSTTTTAGTSGSHAITLTPSAGMSVDAIYSVAVTSTGSVVVGADQTDTTGSSEVDLWTASVSSDAATVARTNLDVGGDIAAVSPNGSYAVFTDGSDGVTTLDLSNPDAAPLNTELGWTSAVAVDNSGNTYAVGDRFLQGPQLWKVPAGTSTVIAQNLPSAAVSVALAGSKVLVGEELDTDTDSTYSLQVFDGTDITTPASASIALPNQPFYLAVSPDNDTAFASAGYNVERVDLTNLGSYTDLTQVPDRDSAAGIVGIIPTSDAFYAVNSDYDGDANAYGNASLSRLTKPGAVTDATQTIYRDGSIGVQWTAPADNGGSDLTYVVTATDQAAPYTVTTVEATDPSAYLDSVEQGHTYTITVRAENTALAGDDVAVAPVLPGTATVTVSGSAVVGGTLTAHVSNQTWPEGTQMTYQWFYSGGEFGGAVEGATKTTFSPTANLVGMQVGVMVTASHAGYSPVDVTSATSVVTAAATPAQQPVQVTKIKPATIKPSAKKVKLTLPGIDVAKAPGKVKVYDGKKLVGTAKIVNGKLVVKFKQHLGHGQHKLKLNYKGSAQVAAFHKKVKIKVK